MTDFSGWSPAFQVDTDTVGSANRADILSIDTGGPSGGATVTITTTSAHAFEVGSQVTISGLTGVYEIVNGAYPIIEVPSATTFRFALATNLAPATVGEGLALSPSPSYVRYGPHDTLLDTATVHVTLRAELWDYNTIRVMWGVDSALDTRAAQDIANGRTPLVVITRSGFGSPVTPLDGVQVLAASYETFMTSVDRTQTAEYVETMPANPDNDWNRPPLEVQSLYDRNLTPGHWYYYTIFFHLGRYDDLTEAFIDQVWVRGGSMDALTPQNHFHAERLYGLLPEYYQMRDQEYLAGTGRRGVVERLLQVVGFEVDITRTLADGIERVYDIDHTHDDLMHSVGVFNFGVPVEDGLGDIRYRSLLATVSNLYEIRGSALGLQQMTNAATKYRSKIIDGSNMLNLTDDAEFASGTGSWSNPMPLYADVLGEMEWLGRDIVNFDPAAIAAVPLVTIPEAGSDSLVVRRNAMLVNGGGTASMSPLDDVAFNEPVNFNFAMDFDGAGEAADGLLLCCGLGLGFQEGRRHEPVETQFYPRLHGVRCRPGDLYTFSGYSVLADDPAEVGLGAVGIMWFNDVDEAFHIETDFIEKSESLAAEESTSADPDLPGPFRRYFVDAKAPMSLRGEDHVFGVPYFVFLDASPRYVSACMFHLQSNSAESVTIPTPAYLRMGVSSQPLGSDYMLGSPA